MPLPWNAIIKADPAAIARIDGFRMSPSSTAYMSSPLASRPARPLVPSTGLTLTGVLLFVIGVLVVASGYVALRPQVMGVSLHAALVPMAAAFPLVLLARGSRLPMRVMIGLIAFTSIYSISVINGASVAMGEIIKIGSTFATIVTCTLLVRSRADFIAGSLGLALGVAALAIPGITAASGTLEGVEVLEGANKNTYSMFALPIVLLSGYIYLNMPISRLVKWVLIACSTNSLLVIFMSANRSGYVGAALVALMLFWNRRGRGMILVLIVGAVVGGWVVYSGNEKAFDRRLQQTVQGNKSDDLRKSLAIGSIRIALENPIMGVSPQRVPHAMARELARLTGESRAMIASHNILAQIAAGSGLLCLAALLYLGWALCNPCPLPATSNPKTDPVRQVRRLMRMMIILWLVRGMFTHEIHFNISFNIAIGLILGLFILTLQEQQASQNAGYVGLQPRRI